MVEEKAGGGPSRAVDVRDAEDAAAVHFAPPGATRWARGCPASNIFVRRVIVAEKSAVDDFIDVQEGDPEVAYANLFFTKPIFPIVA